MFQKQCSRCKGTGQVQAMGGWVSEYDHLTCDWCKGSGKEPLTKKQKIFQLIVLIVVLLIIIFSINQIVTEGLAISEPLNLDPCRYCGAIRW